MAKKVEILSNGVAYSVWCNEGEEDKIVRLGTELEARSLKISRTLRPNSDAHALFLTALILLSEVHEANRKEKEAEEKVEAEEKKKLAREEEHEKEILSLKAELSIATRQVGFLADLAEQTLADFKEKLSKEK